MRCSSPLAALLLWQSALLVNIGTVAAPEHLRFERPIDLTQPLAANVACVGLDATVLGHTSSAAHDDLRLFRSVGGEPEAETPYILTESGPEPVGDTDARVERLHVERGSGGKESLSFDLRMPDRPFSEMFLQLGAHDFVGTATVTGIGKRGLRSALGSFAVFDLSRQTLGRWTVLPMAEASFPELHVSLALRSPDGRPIRDLSPTLVQGATVPPSREAQTLFAPVAETAALTQTGSATVGTLHLPAHVPVERVSVRLRGDAPENFSGEVDLFAKPDGQSSADTEAIDAGTVEAVRLPSGDPRLNPIDVHRLSLDATVGATLGSSATVRVVVRNHGSTAPPIRSIALEMRQRKLCFFANPGTSYTLRYGDPALAAPVYDDTALLSPGATTEEQLGPERRNPRFSQRRDGRPYLRRHPEVIWLLVLTMAGLTGGTLLHRVQQEGM